MTQVRQSNLEHIVRIQPIRKAPSTKERCTENNTPSFESRAFSTQQNRQLDSFSPIQKESYRADQLLICRVFLRHCDRITRQVCQPKKSSLALQVLLTLDCAKELFCCVLIHSKFRMSQTMIEQDDECHRLVSCCLLDRGKLHHAIIGEREVQIAIGKGIGNNLRQIGGKLICL